MALTAEKYQALKDVGLIDVFLHQQDAFEALARTAYTYAKSAIGPSGQAVRHDDVTGSLALALTHNDSFRTLIKQKKLREKYWKTWFAELVVDDRWEAMKNNESESGT